MNHKPVLRFAAALLLTFMLLGVSLQPTQAAEFDPDGSLGDGEVVNDDLFTAANFVTIDGVVNGNLLASGSTVTIHGTVNGDAVLIANSIYISEGAIIDGNLVVGSATIDIAGKVTGSVFGGSAAITLKESAVVGRNVYYGGYSLEQVKGSQVGADLFAGVYQAMLKGNVARDARLAAGAVELSGEIGRDAVIELGETAPEESEPPSFVPSLGQPGIPPSIQPGLRVAEGAVIKGRLAYTASQPMTSGIQVQPEGGVVYATPVPPQTPSVAKPSPRTQVTMSALNWLWRTLRNLVTLLILGLLSVWLLPVLLKQAAEQARAQTLPAAGIGVVTVLVVYLSAFVATIAIFGLGLLVSLLTLGGLSKAVFGLGYSGLALVVTVFTLLVTYGSKLVVAYLGGQWIMDRLAPEARGKSYLAMAIGVLIYVILAAIPFVGWVFALIATLIGIGALWLVYRAWSASRHPQPAATVAA